MKKFLTMSDKGQVTLPAAMRKMLGLNKRSALTVEVVGGKIVLTPAVVFETELYTDKRIAEWSRADTVKNA